MDRFQENLKTESDSNRFLNVLMSALLMKVKFNEISDFELN
jgi:hypothetical protein